MTGVISVQHLLNIFSKWKLLIEISGTTFYDSLQLNDSAKLKKSATVAGQPRQGEGGGRGGGGLLVFLLY